jgi:hypothetical protein
LLCAGATPAFAQHHNAAATLAVNMSVEPSIQLVFQNHNNGTGAGNCPLSNAGTNNVGLNLGEASVGGHTSSCATFNSYFVVYTIASTFDVVVNKANSNSASYTLQAQLSTAPDAYVGWSVNGNNLNSNGLTSLGTAETYGQAVPQTLQVTVWFLEAAGSLQETITFLATAN